MKVKEQWWGPAGFTNPRCEVDVRPGGVLRIDEVLNTVTLAEQGGKTKLTVQAQVVRKIAAVADRHLKGQEQGWSQSLERLEEFL